MSVSRGNGQNGGHFYSNITQPVKINVQFTVDNSNGLGITSLKSNGYVRNIFMHTTATPASNNGYLNPNPAAGYCLVQFNNNYKYFLDEFFVFQSPLSGSSLTSTTIGLAYVIVTLGTTTAAQWLAAGVPPGVTPAVGVSFIAIATGAIGGTGTVNVPATNGSLIVTADIIGDPTVSLNNTSLAANGGAWVLVRFMNGSMAITAPAAGSICSMAFDFDISTVTIDGL